MKLARALAMAAVVAAAACGGDGDPTGAGGNGSIRGTVSDNMGAVVANVVVGLTGNGQPARTASSGADGVYVFANVPAGTYTLAVTPPAGYTAGAAGPTAITVAGGAESGAAAFVLSRASGSGSIRGVVTDNTGASVANATVALSGNAQAARSASSNASGVYTFADVPAGTYTLAITPPAGFTTGGAGTAAVTVANGVQANASAFVLNRVTADPCALVRPDFGGPASEADRALFAYDASAPLNLQKNVVLTNAVMQSSTISYTSPDGGLVTGILTEPVGRAGLRPGLVILPPSGGGATGMAPYAQLLAAQGAVVIVIDAPYVRRGGTSNPMLTEQDRKEQIQLMKDLQRAVDVLRANPIVDDDRIGFEGYSYGGILGAQFVGIEKRLKAAVLAAAMGGQVTGITSPANIGYLGANTTCAMRTAWFRDMVPIEPIRFIPHATPTQLFFQIARFDTAVLPDDAQALYNAASSPKEVRYYDTGHGFNAQALYDRQFWLHQQLGMDAPPPLP